MNIKPIFEFFFITNCLLFIYVNMYDASLPAGNYMFRVNNRNTRRHWRRSGVFIVNFEHISHLVIVVLLLILSR